MSPDGRRRALASIAVGRIVLICPSAWAGIRPISMSLGQWRRARGEVLRSIEQLLPLDAEDASIGLVSRGSADAGPDADGEESAGAGSYLIGVRTSQLQPWIDALEAAVGRRIDEVVTPHMVLSGLGHQRDPKAIFTESSAILGEVAHELSFGSVVGLDEPRSSGQSESAGAPLVPLPDLESGTSVASGLSAEDIGIGAALAPLATGESVAPLRGRSAPAPKRWVLPVAAAMLAIGLFAGADAIQNRRYDLAADRAVEQQLQIEQEFNAVLDQRAELDRLITLLGEDIQVQTAGWGSVMPLLVAARQTIPAEGFLYELQLNDRNITLVGEAPRSRVVLTNLEQSPEFESALNVHPPSGVIERAGMETFNVRAARATNTGGGS